MNPTQDDMNNLKAWLQANEIENVLIPCERGVKYPLFNYKGSIWDWSAFETWTKSDTCVNAVPAFDWAIILKTMAVVDVDDMDVMASLEARFPCLLECPAVLTKKGKQLDFFILRFTISYPLFHPPPPFTLQQVNITISKDQNVATPTAILIHKDKQ